MKNRLITLGVLLGAIVLNSCQSVGGGIVAEMVDNKTPFVKKGKQYSLRFVLNPDLNINEIASSHYLIEDNKGGEKIKAASLLNLDQTWNALMEKHVAAAPVPKAALKRFEEVVDILSSEDGKTIVIRESVENDDDGPFGSLILVQLGEKQGAYKVKLPAGMYRQNPVTDHMWKDDRETAQKLYDEWLSTDYTPKLLLVTNGEIHVEHWTGKLMKLKITEIKGSPAATEL